MNKTIKQAERYEAPTVMIYAVSLKRCILQGSVSGDNIPDFEEENVDWN